MTQVEERLELDPLPTDVNEINVQLQSILLVLSQHSQSLSVVHHVQQIRLYPHLKSCLFSASLTNTTSLIFGIFANATTVIFFLLQLLLQCSIGSYKWKETFVFSLFHQLQY